MNGWRTVVAVVLAVGLLAQAATAANPWRDPETLCWEVGEDNTLVGVAPDGTVYENDVALYDGSRLQLVYCSADAGRVEPQPAGTSWDIESMPGLVVDDRGDRVIEVHVDATGVEDGTTIDAFEHVEGRTNTDGISITVRTGRTVESNLTDAELVAGDAYRRNESQFVRAAERLDDSTARLDASNLTVSNRTLARVSEQYDTLRDASDRLDTQLYALAWADGSETELAVMEATTRKRSATENRTRDRLRSYLDEVRTAKRNAERGIGLQLLVGIVPGFLLGGFLGSIRPRRRGKEVDYKRKYSKAEYGIGVTYLEVGSGVLALAGGVGLFVTNAGVVLTHAPLAVLLPLLAVALPSALVLLVRYRRGDRDA